MSEELYSDGKWKIVRETASLPDGRTKTTERGYHFDTCHILAFPTPKTVLVLREFRAFNKTWVWMIPSGKIDKENDPLAAAQRELQEETGFRAKSMKHWCSMVHSETYVPVSHFFIASDLLRDPLPQDEDEMIEVHELGLEEAIKRILESPSPRMSSAFALLRYVREYPEAA
ncbi:NUDIX hydrolase [Candidatus Peribacteria bacterium]|nr:NUDIX hydrolase [Candidatus Peribacteria bacterium]